MPRTRAIRIATRSSPMAVHQADQVATALEALDPTISTELVKVTTAGDRWMGDLALAKLGGKGAFITEINCSLLDDQADLAVHCLKDIPGDVPVPDGLAFARFLPREDIHDAVITRSGARLAELPGGSVIGTSSVRRTAQLRVYHPHLHIKPLRGNVNTRLMRLDEGHFDGLIAAMSGLHRVRQADRRALQFTDRRLRHHRRHRPAFPARQGVLPRRLPVADSHHWGTDEDPQALGFFVGSDLLRQAARALIDAYIPSAR